MMAGAMLGFIILWSLNGAETLNYTRGFLPPPPDINQLKPPPIPPGLDYTLACGKHGVEAMYDTSKATVMPSSRTAGTMGPDNTVSTAFDDRGAAVKTSTEATLSTKASETHTNATPSRGAQTENESSTRHFGAYVAIGVLSSVVLVLIAVLVLVKKRYVRYPVQPDDNGENSNFLWNYRLRGWKFGRRTNTDSVEAKHFAVVTMSGGEGHEKIQLKTKVVLDSGSSSGISVGSSGSTETAKLASHVYPDIVQSAIKPVQLPPIRKPKAPTAVSAPTFPLLKPIESTENPDTSHSQDAPNADQSTRQLRSRRGRERNDDIPTARLSVAEASDDTSSRSKKRRRKRRRERSEARRRANLKLDLSSKQEETDTD